MNLNAFFTLASLADNVGLDWWHYKTADGHSIRQALDYLIPFAFGEKSWEAEQIKRLDTANLYPILCQAAISYQDENYTQIAAHLVNKKMRKHTYNLI